MSDINSLFSDDLIIFKKVRQKFFMNKYALITGASRGIGKSIANALAKEGYNLILTCHNKINQLNEYVQQLTTQ